MNTRQFTRVPFKTEAFVKSAKNLINGEIENLSLNGMFLKTTERLPPEEPVEVGISLTGDSSELAIHLQGQVLRTDDAGMAIQFSMKGIDIDSFIHLRNIIAYNQSEGDKVMEEYFEFLQGEEKSSDS